MITNAFIPAAYAAGPAAAGPAFDFMGFVPFLLIIGIMYFFLIRPQQKKAKEHQDMLKTISKGDQVLTAGGVFATVTRVVDDGKLEVEIAPGVMITILRSSVGQIVTDKKAASAVANAVSPVASADVKRVKKAAANKK